MVIAADPDVMRSAADAAVHAGEQSWIHVEAEKYDDIPRLMDTLVPDGPYAYSSAWAMISAGAEFTTMKVPIDTTREAIEAGYIELKKHRLVISQLALNEIRGTWYTFQEGETRALNKDTGDIEAGVGLVLFPVAGEKGITGELIGGPRRGLPVATTDEERLELRRQLIARHDEYLQALARADVSGVLKCFTPDAQSAIHDYVNETGTLTVLDGEQEHRRFYEALFQKYEIRSVDLLCRVTQHWYLFAEIRMTVSNDKGTFGFQTAEILVPGPELRFIDRIGHGTRPSPY